MIWDLGPVSHRITFGGRFRRSCGRAGARFSSYLGVRVQYQDDLQTHLPTLMALICR